MKKILVYCNSMNPAGGIERVVATLCNKLSSYYEITILVKDNPVSFYKLENNIHLLSLNKELKLNMNNKLSRIFASINTIISCAKRLKFFLQENHFDYYYLTHPLNVLEFYLVKAERNKIIISEHGAKNAYNFVYKSLKTLLYKRCKAYIVPTKTDTNLYKVENGFPAIYIPHFKSILQYEFIKPKKEKIALNIGRFTKDKQQLKLLKIWHQLIEMKMIDGWKLYIVGKGELEKELKLYIENHHLKESIFLCEPKQSVEDYYLQASIFLLTSKSEGFGMVLLEALSFGLPCISFDCPSGPRDMIHDDFNGYLIAQDDVKEFQQTLLKLIQNESKLADMMNNAYESSLNWNDEIILKKWINLLT